MSSNGPFIIIQLIFIILLLFNFVYTGDVEIIENGSKYEKEDYINLFEIPFDMMTVYTNAGESFRLSSAFNKEENTKWVSMGKHGKEWTDIKTNTKYDSLIPNVTITFNKKVLVNRIIYKSYSIPNCEDGIGYPIELRIYYKNRDSNGELSINDKDFILIENIRSRPTGKKVLFTFDSAISCDQIKIEWARASICTLNNYGGVVTAEEIILLVPESQYINDNIINAFDENDYRQITLSKEYQDKLKINSLKKELNTYQFSENLRNYIERIIGITNGSIIYDPKREFTTNQNAEINKLFQRGDVKYYSKNKLLMRRGSTNRQLTGIYGRSNETITIYVSSEENDRLPCFVFTQYIGTSKDFLGNNYCLTKKKASFKFTNFKTEDYVIPSPPGGPIYFTNPYTPEEQSQNIKIYVEGGVLFPIIRIEENEDNYMNNLEEYVKLVEKDNITNPDITEFHGNRVMVSVRATDAYRIYKGENKSVIQNLKDWDRYIKKLFIYDGIQFEKYQPYYDEKNNYICFHLRYSQPYALAYASEEYIGIFYDDWLERAISIDEKNINWGFPHEIGHMMDIDQRTVSETSNNMISKYSETYLQGDGTWGPDRVNSKIKYLTPNDINDKLRGCKSDDENQCHGFFKNIELNYLVWWDLESMFHGYWGQLDNMYRFNSSLVLGLTKTEKLVYFTNLILGMDLGYYFARWGFNLGNFNDVFNESSTSPKYQELMDNATKNGLIDASVPKKKYWYLDYKQYNYMESNMYLGCYEDPNEYEIEIKDFTDYGIAGLLIELKEVKCPGHLGFEIYERDKLIGFTHNSYFIDENKYEDYYIRKYKIIAYDRLLFPSKPSLYMSPDEEDFLLGLYSN